MAKLYPNPSGRYVQFTQPRTPYGKTAFGSFATSARGGENGAEVSGTKRMEGNCKQSCCLFCMGGHEQSAVRDVHERVGFLAS